LVRTNLIFVSKNITPIRPVLPIMSLLFVIYSDFALHLVSAIWPTNDCMFLAPIASMRRSRH
jgi:hypothetical protein